MTNGNITINGDADTLRALFGGALPANVQPTNTVAEGRARLSFAGQTVDIDPDEAVNVADAFAMHADALGLNTGRVVTYSVDGEIIPASEAVEPGLTYVATTKHDDKG